MEHLSTEVEQHNNKYNGEETKCKSLAAKDTAKERYPNYCKLVDKYTNSESHFIYLDKKNRIH